MTSFTQKQIVSIRQFGVINCISACRYSAGKEEVTVWSSLGAGRNICDIWNSVNWTGK